MATATRAKKIDDDVLTALRSIEFDDNIGRLTCGQLDRKVYVKTNEVLESLGGKWNKKLKGHLFENEARDVLDATIDAGQFISAADEKQLFQFFETPEDLADEIIQLACIEAGHRVFEPSAGHGRLVNAAAKRVKNPKQIAAIELQKKNCDELKATDCGVYFPNGRDFLSVKPSEFVPFDRIVMNPPFTRQQDIQHVLHAWEFLTPGGRLVSIMASSWTFRGDKRSGAFRKFVEQHGTWNKIESGAFRESGTMVNSTIVILDKPDASNGAA